MTLWTARDAANATGGSLAGATGWQADGVSIDSRTLQPGDLFVALKGPQADGHDHVAAALAAGAAAALVHRVPAGLPPEAPLLVVADSAAGLEALGRAGRQRSGARVAAITGSVGKTTTKEMLRLALASTGPTHASAASHNNHWGVPLTLARLPPAAAFCVAEAGMNHAGELTLLSRQIRPHLALITTVEAVHLEFFADVGGIADAKAEIFTGLEPGGIAMINQDNPWRERLRAAARAAGAAEILGFGRDPAAPARLVELEVDAEGTRARLDLFGRHILVGLRLSGAHWALNALAALAAAVRLGAPAEAAAAAVGTLEPLAGRGLRRQLALAGGGTLTLMDESYNASPVAVAAALEALGRAGTGPGGRRIAVLGDMLELGPSGPALHAGLAEAATAAGIDLVFTCGPLSAHLAEALPAGRRGAHAADATRLAPLVTTALRPGDVVLVKGSLGSRMARVVQALDALAG